MIPLDYIRSWQINAPWPLLRQVEQDLIISRALVELYKNPVIASKIAFRGGTALHKLFIKPAARYSEDLDFVQINEEPIGNLLDEIRKVLDSWLGKASSKLKNGRATLFYKFTSESENIGMKLKIEINTIEHFCFDGLKNYRYQVNSRWFNGEADISSYSIEELLATKLRALYQRNKGRDLFDLWLILKDHQVDLKKVISIFKSYIKKENNLIIRSHFQKNISEKLINIEFQSDMNQLIRADLKYDVNQAAQLLNHKLLSLL